LAARNIFQSRGGPEVCLGRSRRRQNDVSAAVPIQAAAAEYESRPAALRLLSTPQRAGAEGYDLQKSPAIMDVLRK